MDDTFSISSKQRSQVQDSLCHISTTYTFGRRRFKFQSLAFNTFFYLLVMNKRRLVISIHCQITCFLQNLFNRRVAHLPLYNANACFGNMIELEDAPKRRFSSLCVSSVVVVPMTRNGSEKKSLVRRVFTRLFDIAFFEVIVLALMELIILYLYRDYTISFIYS